MRKYILLSLAVILLVLVVIKIFNNSGKGEKQTAKAGAVAVPAECYLVRDTVIDVIYNAVGYLKANERIEVISELSRRVTDIPYREGSMVKMGDLLFQLDDAEWQASMKKNVAEHELARQTEVRLLKLLNSGGTSQQVYDEAVSRLKMAEAEAESLKVLIEKARIRASFSGKAGIRNVSVGAFVSPGTVLTCLEDLSSLKLDLTVPESYGNTIKTGDLIAFKIDGDPKEYQAIIEAVDPSVNTSTGSLRILARVRSQAKELIPGRAITVNLKAKTSTAGIYLPTEALIPTPSGYKIYAVSSGKAVQRPVTTGLRTDKMVEITEGIKAGDSVLVTGFMKVRPDSKLKILKTW